MNQKNPPTRGQLLRHVLVCQLKLAVDSISDVFLSPILLIPYWRGPSLTIQIHPVTSISCCYWATDLISGVNLFNTHSEGSNSPTADDFIREAGSIARSELEKGALMPKLWRSTKKPKSYSSEKDDQELPPTTRVKYPCSHFLLRHAAVPDSLVLPQGKSGNEAYRDLQHWSCSR